MELQSVEIKFLHFSKCWLSVTNAHENLGGLKQADSIVAAGNRERFGGIGILDISKFHFVNSHYNLLEESVER